MSTATKTWDIAKAVAYLESHAFYLSLGTASHHLGGRSSVGGAVAATHHKTGHCAKAVVAAIHAGGITVGTTLAAKDFGPHLKLAGFAESMPTSSTGPFRTGDVVVIQDVSKGANKQIKHDHPYGHMAMFSGREWISDFHQVHGSDVYSVGGDYRVARPSFRIYRYATQTAN